MVASKFVSWSLFLELFVQYSRYKIAFIYLVSITVFIYSMYVTIGGYERFLDISPPYMSFRYDYFVVKYLGPIPSLMISIKIAFLVCKHLTITDDNEALHGYLKLFMFSALFLIAVYFFLKLNFTEFLYVLVAPSFITGTCILVLLKLKFYQKKFF